jgi:hypothetical protein
MEKNVWEQIKKTPTFFDTPVHYFKVISFFFHEIESRVFLETSFDSKQAKLELKLVSVLSKTASFGVSIELKLTEDQPKQFDREHILVPYFSENFGLSWFVSKQLCLFHMF